MLPENALKAGNNILSPSFKLCKSFPHHWKTCFLSLYISDMCHHWRNIYCSWDPRLLHFHSVRGLEEDPAGENAVTVKLYPSLQGQEQRLRNLPLPVFVFIFYLIESVSFSLIRLFSEDVFNKSKKSPCISELWEWKINGIRAWISILSPQKERLKCHIWNTPSDLSKDDSLFSGRVLWQYTN